MSDSQTTPITIDTIVELAKRRGFIFPGSEIYGGLRNSWDYGPLGVELKNNVKQLWWRMFVQQRLDIVGLDAAILMNPKVWEASGHVATFNDPLVECKKCHNRFRADVVNVGDPCPECGACDWSEARQFNLMLKTFLGPAEEQANIVYFRPETAQAIFVDFPSVLATTRKRVPFGIAQVGKAFRNEITPGNFIFRTREFEQMEIEFFVHPNEWEHHFEGWLKEIHRWIVACGIDEKRVSDLEVPAEERAHYSKRTVDIEFEFPFGKGELYGLAYRGDYDLSRHAEYSGRDVAYTDPETNEKFIPHVIEPSLGVDRTVLAVLISAYHEEEVRGEKRVVLKLKPELAPYQVAVLPLSKKEELIKVAEPLAQELLKDFRCDYDITQSIGRRYRRQDEIGTPYCVTVDFDSLEDKQVTVRNRDTMEQDRIPIDKVSEYLKTKLQQ